MINVKKILTTITIITSLCLCMLPMYNSKPVLAEETTIQLTISGDYGYALDDNNNAIIYKYYGTTTDLTLPSKLDNHTVTTIGESAFEDNETIETIKLSDTITTIEKRAFWYSSISEIDLNNIKYINDSAFVHTNIENITIPKTFKDGGRNVFEGSKLKSIIFEEGITTIPDDFCSWTSYLVNVTIPDSITYIGDNAFYDCISLTEIDLNNVEKLGTSVFSSSAIQSITIPKTLVELPKGGALGSSFGKSIKTIEFEEGSTINEIPEGCFDGCKNITNIEIPDSVKTIDTHAFSSCTNLTEIDLNNVTHINQEAFEDCTNLKNVYIHNNIAIDDYDFMDNNNIFNGCYNVIINVDKRQYASSYAIKHNYTHKFVDDLGDETLHSIQHDKSYYCITDNGNNSINLNIHTQLKPKEMESNRIKLNKAYVLLPENLEITKILINNEEYTKYKKDDYNIVSLDLSDISADIKITCNVLDETKDIKTFAYINSTRNDTDYNDTIDVLEGKLSDLFVTELPTIPQEEEIVVTPTSEPINTNEPVITSEPTNTNEPTIPNNTSNPTNTIKPTETNSPNSNNTPQVTNTPKPTYTPIDKVIKAMSTTSSAVTEDAVGIVESESNNNTVINFNNKAKLKLSKRVKIIDMDGIKYIKINNKKIKIKGKKKYSFKLSKYKKYLKKKKWNIITIKDKNGTTKKFRFKLK